jgi:hypothetical protein
LFDAVATSTFSRRASSDLVVAPPRCGSGTASAARAALIRRTRARPRAAARNIARCG